MTGAVPRGAPALGAVAKARTLGRLPAELRGPKRATALNRSAWGLLSSKRAEAEMQGSTLLSRTLRPFADVEAFPDLGPYEPFRHWEESERVLATTRPARIDPVDGWAVVPLAHRVNGGVLDIEVASGPKVIGYAGAVLRPTRSLEEAEVLSLRDRGERNFAHFLTDLVGGRLRLAAEAGLDDVPILVGEGLYRSRLFQDFLRLSPFGDRRYVVQGDRYLRTRKAYLFDVAHYRAESTRFVHAVLPVPDESHGGSRRVMVSRRRGVKGGRGFTNLDQVADTCQSLGFELLETDDMALDEQIRVFSETSVLAGASGAGLSNVMFRRAPGSLLEIFPPRVLRPRPWWYSIAANLGHRYHWMEAGGEPGRVTGREPYMHDFHLDTEVLQSKLEAVLEAAGEPA